MSICAQDRHSAVWPQGSSFTRAPGPPQGQNTVLEDARALEAAALEPRALEKTGMGSGARREDVKLGMEAGGCSAIAMRGELSKGALGCCCCCW